jgi:hypothetical protein
MPPITELLIVAAPRIRAEYSEGWLLAVIALLAVSPFH